MLKPFIASIIVLFINDFSKAFEFINKMIIAFLKVDGFAGLTNSYDQFFASAYMTIDFEGSIFALNIGKTFAFTVFCSDSRTSKVRIL